MPGTRWTADQLSVLKENYSDRKLLIDDVAKMVGHSRMGTALKAMKLGLFKNWSTEEKEMLRSQWTNPAITTVEICRRLKRDKKHICAMAYWLGVKRPSKQNASAPWSEEQVNLFREHYHKMPPDELSQILCKSEKAMYSMARKLGIPPKPWGVRLPDKANRARERATLLSERPYCAVTNCVGWEDVLDIHHERDGSVWVLCTGHHARITRGKAKIINGKYTLL